jgi:hypothetical protein
VNIAEHVTLFFLDKYFNFFLEVFLSASYKTPPNVEHGFESGLIESSGY